MSSLKSTGLHNRITNGSESDQLKKKKNPREPGKLGNSILKLWEDKLNWNLEVSPSFTLCRKGTYHATQEAIHQSEQQLSDQSEGENNKG